MRLSKFILVALVITLVSLLYVYQQTEIFRLAYLDQKKTLFQDLLAKNSILRYNIDKNASLVCIGNKISKDADFQMPDSYRLMKMAPKRQLAALSASAQDKESMLSRIFSVKREAQAKTFNP